MKAFRLSLIVVLTAAAMTPDCSAQSRSVDGFRSFFRGTTDVRTVFRGQSPDTGTVPLPVTPGAAAPDAGSTGTAAPSGTAPEFYSGPTTADSFMVSPDMSMPMYQDTTTWNAFSPPLTPDPFLGQPGYGIQPGPYAPYAPYGAGQPGMQQPALSTYGANGAQPYRYGWQNAIDVSFLPGSGLTAPAGGATGDMEIFGVDYDLAYSTPFVPGWILNWTNQFAYRNWNGPTGVSIPGDVFRFGMDFELETPQAGPASISLGITPSINTDFNASTSEGFQLDGRGILLMQLDPYWTLGLGAMYWDRVKDRVIPYAGLIYRDDYWEWQLMYPEARVSLFLGNETYWSKWLYVRGEYHVEAYGIEQTVGGAAVDGQIELEDYRILIGMKMDSGLYNWFFEGGWVTNRDVTFSNGAVPGYKLDTGFIGQVGLRY